MKQRLTRIHIFLLGSALISMPFVSSVGKESGLLGTMGAQLSYYFIFGGFLVWLAELIFSKKKCLLPNNLSFKLVVVLLLIMYATTLLNAPELLTRETKGVLGIQKSVVRLLSFSFAFLLSVYLYNVFRYIKYDALRFIYKLTLCSFFLAGTYSLIEVACFLDTYGAMDLLLAIDKIFRPEEAVGFYWRIRSLGMDAPSIAIYWMFLFPWLLVPIILSKKFFKLLSIVCVAYLLLLVVGGISRTSSISIAVEFLMFLFLFRKELSSEWYIFPSLAFIITVVTCLIVGAGDLISMSPSEVITSLLSMDGDKALSNIGRYGSTLAAVDIFFDHPIIGVGWGAYGLYAADYYPDWAWVSPEIQQWGSNGVGMPWAEPWCTYIAFFCQCGILGGIIYILVYVHLLAELKKVYKNLNYENSVYARALFISFLGVALFGFNLGNVLLFITWLSYVSVWALSSIYRSDKTAEMEKRNEKNIVLDAMVSTRKNS